MSASDKKRLRKEQEAASLTEKQISAQKEAKDLKNYTFTFAIIMTLVVAIAVGTIGVNLWNNSGIPSRNTIALTIGDRELTNTELNYYFVDSVNAFYDNMYSSYGNYTVLYCQMMYGLDMTQPLSLQTYNKETGETWADYFLNDAINSAESVYALYNAAVDAEYELTEAQESILTASLASVRSMAAYYGYSSLESYVKAVYGSGADEETFLDYYRVTYTADCYYTHVGESFEYDDETMNNHNQENYNDFTDFSYNYYYVSANDFRGAGNVDEEGNVTYTDEQLEAAREAAKEAADALAEATDLAMLNLLIRGMEINEGKDEDDSDMSCTEINGAAQGSISELYREWIVDDERTANETTVVPYYYEVKDDEGNVTSSTLSGYYVVMFEERDENNEYMVNVRHLLIRFQNGKVENGETVYSDEEKQKAWDEAQELYDEWVAAGATEEGFIEMATEHSDDSSRRNGGLIEDIYLGQMVESFDEWCFDESRQTGDYGILETEYGVHIMYFDSVDEWTYRQYLVDLDLRNADITEWYEDLNENITSVKVDTSYILTDMIIYAS